MRIARLQKIKLTDPIYQSELMLLVGGNVDSVRTYLERRHGSGVRLYNKLDDCTEEMGVGETSDGLQFHVNGDKETFYMWLSVKDVDTLWHEVYHLVNDVLFCRGIKYSDNAEDAYAYWGGAVFAQAFYKLYPRSQ